ncbi:hypothetical protein EMIT0357P_10006 [Pseudomonas marginalis]
MVVPVELALRSKKPEASLEGTSGFLFAMARLQPVKLNFRSVPTHIYLKLSFFNGIRSGKPDDLCSGRCP